MTAFAQRVMGDRPLARFGVGLRKPYFGSIVDCHPGVDFVEIVSENFMDMGGQYRDVLERVGQRLDVVPHGVSLSLGSPEPLDAAYLDELEQLLRWVRPPWFSDHLSYASAFGVAYHDLIPLPFTWEAIRHVVPRIRALQDRMGLPFLVENPSYYIQMPGAEMTEAEFINEVVELADCGLLLDVNNVFVNSRNQGYDPYEFIDAMPASRVLQLHMAGHDATGAFIMDTHAAPIVPEVYRLYQHTLRRVGPCWTLLEWDASFPELSVLLAENDRVRAAADAALGAAVKVASA